MMASGRPIVYDNAMGEGSHRPITRWDVGPPRHAANDNELGLISDPAIQGVPGHWFTAGVYAYGAVIAYLCIEGLRLLLT